MKLAVDVDYRFDKARVGGVFFEDWQDTQETLLVSTIVDKIEDYVPGQFFRRELPCIEALLKEHALKPELIIIDGFVFLDGMSRAGLGKHLYDALNQKIPIIGVAKNPFKDIPKRFELLRGQSKTPLYVTATGLPQDETIAHITAMAGDYRIPTLLKKADAHCRDWSSV